MSLLRAFLVALVASAALAIVLLTRGDGLPVRAQQPPLASPSPTGTPASPQQIPLEVFNGMSWAGEQLLRRMQGLGSNATPSRGRAAQPSAGAVRAAGAQGGADVAVIEDFGVQNETTLAAHGGTICAGYNDFGPGGNSGLSRSPDFGDTWEDGFGLYEYGDPVLSAHHATGTFFYAMLAWIDGESAIGVAKSTDDCRSFPGLANASPAASNATDFQDKPWIAVDNSGGPRDGYVYVCWTRFGQLFPNSEIRFSRSTDGGLTFTDEQLISPAPDLLPICSIDVGPNGEVYVVWAVGGRSTFPIQFSRSLDGGLTWLTPEQVNTTPIRYPGIDRIVDCGEPFPRPTLNDNIRMAHQVWMAVDTTGGPFQGNIYLVWAHDPPGAVDNTDIYFSRSTDGGFSWSPEVQLAGGTETDQFEPFVEVGGDGTVSIAWYDRRNDPVVNLYIDVYTTFSRDGGTTFDPVQRLTDVSFPPITYNCYMGEYLAVAADENNFYYAWGDNRSLVDPDVYFDRLAVPAVVPPPTATPPPPVLGGVAIDPKLRVSTSRASSARDHDTVVVPSLEAVGLLAFVVGASWWTIRRRRRIVLPPDRASCQWPRPARHVPGTSHGGGSPGRGSRATGRRRPHADRLPRDN